MMVKIVGKLRTLGKKEKEKAEKAKPEPAPTKEEILLAEIRDLLKEKNRKMD